MRLIAGSASVHLAKALARELSKERLEVAFERHAGGFPDGERYVRLAEAVVGEHVVLVQTTYPDPSIVEFLL